jgi:hypothetical protein
MLQRRHAHTKRSLPISHGDTRRLFSAHDSGRVSAWKFRVISRAPLLKVT